MPITVRYRGLTLEVQDARGLNTVLDVLDTRYPEIGQGHGQKATERLHVSTSVQNVTPSLEDQYRQLYKDSVGNNLQLMVDALYKAAEGLSHDEMRTVLGGGKWQVPPTLTDAVRKEGKFDLPKRSTIERLGSIRKGTRRYLLSDTFRTAIKPLMENPIGVVNNGESRGGGPALPFPVEA